MNEQNDLEERIKYLENNVVSVERFNFELSELGAWIRSLEDRIHALSMSEHDHDEADE